MTTAIALRIPDVDGTSHWVSVDPPVAYALAEAILERKAFYEKVNELIKDQNIDIPALDGEITVAYSNGN